MIPQPKDKGILLKDVLESEVDEKYYLSNLATDRALNNDRSRLTDINNKCGAILANQSKQSTDMITIVAMRGRNPENTSDRTKGCPIKQMLEPREDGKTNCITTVQKDNLVYTKYNENQFNNKRLNETIDLHKDNLEEGTMIDSYNKSIHKDKSITITTRVNASSSTHIVHTSALNENQKKKFDENPNIDKANCLTLAMGRAGSSDEYMDAVSKIAKIQGKIRRLTPIECCRLQTINDDYFIKDGANVISNSQIYKCVGNGWTVEVVAHIFSFLKP